MAGEARAAYAGGMATPASSSQDTFRPSYTEARNLWLQAARAAGAEIDSLRHPGTGPGGEALWIDLARLGPADGRQCLLVTCGVHGIEGFAGSAVQAAWLQAQGQRPATAAGTAVLLVHAVNPWGFAHRQRVNEDNVDLNRNFIDWAAGVPPNPGYDALQPDLASGDVERAFEAMDTYRATQGEKAFSDAFNGGQHRHADGVFYGGQGAAWSNLAIRLLLRRHAAAAQSLVLVDLHTGIGPYGEPFMINTDPPGSPGRTRALALWGEAALSGRGSTHAAMATYHGLMLDAFAEELPGCGLCAVAIEFGTRERRTMQQAHLSLAWLRAASDRGERVEPAVSQQWRTDYEEAFIPSDPRWRASVLAHGTRLLSETAAALG